MSGPHSVSLAAAAIMTAVAFAQAPFAYQGRLTDNGAPANGAYDFQFRLFDAPTGGSAIGSPVTLNDVTVTDGLFTVILNSGNEFGAAAFNGDSRWLEIAVNGTTLWQRSPILATPYAIKVPGIDGHSLDADGGAVTDAVYVNSAGAVSVGLNPQYGSPALDQFNVSFNNTAVSPGGRWQSFRPAISGQLASIRLRVTNFGMPTAQMGLEVRTGVGAGGTVLGSATVMPPSGTNWVSFDLPNIPVSAEQDLTWRIAFAGSHLISSADFNPYARGQGDLGPNIDYVFETYVRPYTPVPVMTILPSGRVGIGTQTPAQTLSVAGLIESTSQGFRFPDGTTQTSAATASPWQENAGDVYVDGPFVGIGTSDPQEPLEIASSADPRILLNDGSTGGKRFTVGSQSVDDSFAIRNATDNRNLLYLANNGFVGVNTSSAPDAPLTLQAGTGGTAGLVSVRDTGGTNRWQVNLGSGSELQFRPSNLGNWSVEFGPNAAKALTVRGDATITDGDLTLGNGDITVGGQTTTQILHITGGSDIAEPFDVSSYGVGSGDPGAAQPDIQPGMVVVIDPERVGELKLSDKAYDTAVAGIISGANGVNPGMVLSQPGTVADGKHPVAMSGRVWCWVDADQGGPVKPGDLLTTADTPGHAMKASDRERASGATLGKAMSPLARGRGLVLVLVNLQ